MDSASENPIFRPVSIETDRDDWLALRIALWPDCSAEQHLAEMVEILAEPERTTALAAQSREGRLVALAEASIRPFAEGALEAPVVHLEGWFVAPDWRRRGIGRALVELVERWGREHGARELTSDTEVENAASQAAHEALGFEETCRVVNYRRPFRSTTQDSDQS